MAENEVNVAAAEETPSFGKRFVSGVKEFVRKSIVKLKRRPMNIAFLVLIVSSVVNLCYLGNFSQIGRANEYGDKMRGLCVFINQLFCILVLLLFMNSFPKRQKKPKIVQLVLTFAFIAVMIGLDIYLYVTWTSDFGREFAIAQNAEVKNYKKTYDGAVTGVMTHLVLVALAAVLTATYPLYGKLINMINTRKDIGESQLNEEIDTSEET